jgi:hypothetical protein
MKPRSSPATAIGVGAAALLSLFAAMEYYRSTTVYNKQYPDPYRIGFQQERFREAAEMIPEDSVIGYISNEAFETVRGSAGYFGAQWALTPRIVVPHTSQYATDLVLGNFSAAVETAEITSRIESSENMHVVRVLQSGVVLFRTEKSE